jgi:signal recognition particle subunit SRP54
MATAIVDFTMGDFLQRMDEIQRLGGWNEILRTLPGIGSLAITVKDTTSEMRRIKSIVHSMTPAERADGSLMTSSRLLRIARGSGTTSADVSKMIADFYRVRIMMRKLSGLSMAQRIRKIKGEE